MGGWKRHGAVVLGASLLAVAVTGGKAVRGVSYAVQPPDPLRITAPNSASLELGLPTAVHGSRREIAAHVMRERAMMRAALLMLLAEGTARDAQ